MRPITELNEQLARVRSAGGLLGLVAALLCIAAGYFWPTWFFPAYLVAFLFWLGISLGCLGIALLHHLTGGGWGLAIRRVLEAGYGTLPLMAVLFLPLLLGMPTLYVWSRPEVVAADEILQRKADYLNVGWFQIRAAVYFAIWILLGFLASRLTAGTDPDEEPVRRRRLSLLAGPGLVLWVLSITFASVDWGMSLEPHWFSSIYGVLFIGGQGVAGMAFAIICLVLLRLFRPIAEVTTASRVHDLGNLLLAFVMFWSYVSFTQFLIIWSANLPEETPWYVSRIRGGWQFVAISLIVLHFLAPFLLLLVRQTKRDPRRLAAVAALLLGMRLIDLYWLVMPTFSPHGFWLNGMIFLTPVAVGGLWLAWFAWRLPARIALPVFEPPAEDEAHEEVAAHAAT